jgi:hypothetical protein
MKFLFAIILLHCSLQSFSQDKTKIREIDSIARWIDTMPFNVQRDTIRSDFPEYGLFSASYLVAVTDGKQLKKYVNEVHSVTKAGELKLETSSINTFYFHNNQLVKVEESAKKGDEEFNILWYYADDKPLYYTPQTEKSEERAEFLLFLSKKLLEKTKK